MGMPGAMNGQVNGMSLLPGGPGGMNGRTGQEQASAVAALQHQQQHRANLLGSMNGASAQAQLGAQARTGSGGPGFMMEADKRVRRVFLRSRHTARVERGKELTADLPNDRHSLKNKAVRAHQQHQVTNPGSRLRTALPPTPSPFRTATPHRPLYLRLYLPVPLTPRRPLSSSRRTSDHPRCPRPHSPQEAATRLEFSLFSSGTEE